MTIIVAPPRKFISQGHCVYELTDQTDDKLTYTRWNGNKDAIATVFKTPYDATVKAAQLEAGE